MKGIRAQRRFSVAASEAGGKLIFNLCGNKPTMSVTELQASQ